MGKSDFGHFRRLNRTFMELKRDGCEDLTDAHRVLIEPLWN